MDLYFNHQYNNYLSFNNFGHCKKTIIFLAACLTRTNYGSLYNKQAKVHWDWIKLIFALRFITKGFYSHCGFKKPPLKSKTTTVDSLPVAIKSITVPIFLLEIMLNGSMVKNSYACTVKMVVLYLRDYWLVLQHVKVYDTIILLAKASIERRLS